jgi:long-subunit fatty acid transport protein
LRLDLKQEVPAALTDSIARLDWHDVWWLKCGAEYMVGNWLTLRAGYNHMENPVLDSSLEPGDPDADQHDLTIGFGFRRGRLTIDYFLVAVFYEKREVDKSLIAGEFRGRAYLSGLGFGTFFSGRLAALFSLVMV